MLASYSAVFQAKKVQTEFLVKYLDQKVENIDDLACPWVENLNFKKKSNCNYHVPHYNSRKQFALKKSKIFMTCRNFKNSERDWQKSKNNYQQFQCFLRG